MWSAGRFRSGASLLLGAALLAGGVILGSISCMDDIAEPTQGTVEVRLTSSAAGGYLGAAIQAEGEILVEDTRETRYTFRLPAGTRTLSLQKECATVLPSPEIEIQVEPGKTQTVAWEIEPGQGIEVTSQPAGATIFLNGEETGEVTPATLGCVPSGIHTVQVRLLGATAGADSVQTVEVTDQTESVAFELSPLPQQRGALLEVYTATHCPNCPVADAAAENLYDRDEITSKGYVGMQVHAAWGGADALYNGPGTQARLDLFGANSGLPKTFFSGMNPIVGAGSGDIDALTDRFAARVSAIHDGEEGSTPVSLYWMDLQSTPTIEIICRLRIMVLEEVSDPSALELWFLDYKDELEARGLHGMETFYKVVREYKSGGTLQDLGLSQPGDYADVTMRFTLDWDTDPNGELWSEDLMGVVAFVQDMGTKEVFQTVHATVP